MLERPSLHQSLMAPQDLMSQSSISWKGHNHVRHPRYVHKFSRTKWLDHSENFIQQNALMQQPLAHLYFKTVVECMAVKKFGAINLLRLARELTKVTLYVIIP